MKKVGLFGSSPLRWGNLESKSLEKWARRNVRARDALRYGRWS